MGAGFTEEHMCLIKSELKNSNKYIGHCPVIKKTNQSTKKQKQQQKNPTFEVALIFIFPVMLHTACCRGRAGEVSFRLSLPAEAEGDLLFKRFSL